MLFADNNIIAAAAEAHLSEPRDERIEIQAWLREIPTLFVFVARAAQGNDGSAELSERFDIPWRLCTLHGELRQRAGEALDHALEIGFDDVWITAKC